MTVVIYLIIGAHKIHIRMIQECRGITVIPLAVELYEIPVVAVGIYGISLDHHVGNAGTVEEHFRAAAKDITVTVAS